MAILEMKHISKAFAGVYANEAVDLSVEKGEIHALLGENGAGKTTLMNILFGIYQADEGEILWKGQSVRFESPGAAIAQGIGMVHQHFSLVKKMTVMDNIILGLESGGLFLNRTAAREKILDLAARYGLEVDPDAAVYSLSVGQQQRVEILKALYRDVELLILDEPTGVLTPGETEHFFGVLRRLKEEGYAIIIITHRMSEIMSISDRVTILRDGKRVGSLVTAHTNPEELSQAMIGRELKESAGSGGREPGEERLVLSHVSIHRNKKASLLSDVCLTVREGEILGIAGVDGNGQKELAEIIAGVRKLREGSITFEGREIGRLSVQKRFAMGISYISDDRHADGLVLPMTVGDNLILREYRQQPFSRFRVLNRRAAAEAANRAISDYRIKTSGRSGKDTQVRLMSGGNQQKVILAREITGRSRLIIASQPTRGLDIGATEFVRELLIRQRDLGKSVILISADLEEILSLSDRVAVMFGGRIAGILPEARRRPTKSAFSWVESRERRMRPYAKTTADHGFYDRVDRGGRLYRPYAGVRRKPGCGLSDVFPGDIWKFKRFLRNLYQSCAPDSDGVRLRGGF